MNLNLGGIERKLMDKADLVAFLASGYMRFDGDLGRLLHQYTSKDVINELMFSLGSIEQIKWKLLDTGHAYSNIFKMALYGRIATEFGILTKYKKTLDKVLLGSGLAALTLPGSSPPSRSSGFSSSGNSVSWGYNP